MNYASDHDWHRSFLANLARRMKPQCYVELGLGDNPAIVQVSEFCNEAYGVDKTRGSHEVSPNAIIIVMTTDEFFDGPGKTITPPDLVFIDADHRKEQVLKDLANVAAICADNCVVVLHDTFPESAMYTDPGYCADSYKVPDEIPWEHVTLPVPPGLTICRLKARSLV